MLEVVEEKGGGGALATIRTNPIRDSFGRATSRRIEMATLQANVNAVGNRVRRADWRGL